jgi:ABC-2 type transport system permease protein
MSKLLRMEFIFNRKQILIILAIFSAYFAYMITRFSSPRFFLVITSLMVGLAIPIMIVGREDKFKTAALVCSLPVRRSEVVLAKYAINWIMIGFSLAYSLFLAAIFPFAKVSVAGILNLKSLLISLALISLFFCFILPFTTRFGFVGIIIFLVATQVLGIVMILLRQFLGPRLNLLRATLGNLEKGLRYVLNHPGTPAFLLVLVAAILLFNAVSFFITRWLYARREF